MNISRREKYGGGKGFKTIKNEKLNKIDLKFDTHALELMCYYTLTQNTNIKRSHFINMRNLFEMINDEMYRNDPEKIKKFNFIKLALEARLSKNFRDPFLIYKYASGGLSEESVLKINYQDFVLNSEELYWINETVSENLKYSFMFYEVDKLMDLCTRFKTSDYSNKGAIVAEFEMLINDIKTQFRRVSSESINDTIFSLRETIFNELIKDIHAELSSPSSRILTGMQGMNELTYGGFESERVYMFFGLQGEGKSVLLLNLAYQMKKHNKHYECKDPTKRPAVVFLTMENSVKETVERLFDISTGKGEMQKMSVDEVIEYLKNDGELILNDDSPVDIIIKYVHNGSVDTGYLYTLTEDLEDEGIETIALVQDYVMTIRSAHKTGDFRLDLGNVVNEFKTFAIIKGIPVITASQINRDGAKNVDTAKINNKVDLVRTMGRSNVAESITMVNNIDFGAIMQTEYDANGVRYMCFNRFKIRGKKLPRDIICTPFDETCGIKLYEDINDPIPAFKETLRDNVVEPEIAFNNGSRYNTRNNLEEISNNRLNEENNVFLLSNFKQQQEAPSKYLVGNRPSLDNIKIEPRPIKLEQGIEFIA